MRCILFIPENRIAVKPGRATEEVLISYSSAAAENKWREEPISKIQ